MNTTMFDAYFMVDWSANSTPKTGADSIWFCLLRRGVDGKKSRIVRNPANRYEAFMQIRQLLTELMRRNLKILLGFDFAYGYPAGFAGALNPMDPTWRAVWKAFTETFKDSLTNANDRYQVASELNRQITSCPGPFWGCPAPNANAFLTLTRPSHSPFSEYRITDRRLKGPQPVWKLCYPGSVGSQVLLGIPYLHRLRFDSQLSPFSEVWPFETGIRPPELKPKEGRIVHVEIYPSILGDDGEGHTIKDARQVIHLARHFARLDERGKLAHLFSPGNGLTREQKEQVIQEEGWIFGIE
jgi:precorrin-8X/cobalt-precorrin-8 methylmutase